MNRLAEAKKHVDYADEYGTQLDARLAIGRALIAICEHMEQNANLALAS